ncbi:hypothetical protein Tco_0322294 [Tanacetum coccineum]
MAGSSKQEQTPPYQSIKHDQPEEPGTPIPLNPITQVDFNVDEITFKENNEVALIYPDHPNKEHFKVISDFISKCYLREAFTRTPIQYKEYLMEFWYIAKVLKDYNRVWFSTLIGGIKREVGVTYFRNAIGENYLANLRNYEAVPSIETVKQWFPIIGYSGTIEATCTLKKGFLPPRTMEGVDIDTLTMEQYLALSRENQAPGVVKPEIRGNVNFKIKSQFMRELREDTFYENKNEDAHDHIDRVLNIVGLFNILRVSKDAIMLIVFPFTLTEAVKKMGGQTCPRNYQYLGSPQKGLYPKGLIPGMTPAQALTAIQTMADHSQKWHDGTTSRNIVSRISNDGLADLVNKLDKTGTRHEEAKGKCSCNPGWMPNLLKTSPRLRIALIRGKKIKEVRHGEYGQTTPFNGNNEKFCIGPPRYYTKTDNRPPYGERRQSLEELLAKHQEESARRSTEMEVWIKKT